MAAKKKINDHGDVIFSEEDVIELLYTDPDFDISKLYLDNTSINNHITCIDPNKGMLAKGKEKLKNYKNIKWIISGAEKLPLESNSFDFYTISFGLRNTKDLNKSLSEAYRVLKKGGRFFCLEFSKIQNKNLEFVGIDEIQMCNDHERGHILTDRLLHMRGERLTMLMGSNSIKKIIQKLDDDIEFKNRERLSKLSFGGHKKISRIERKSAVIAFSTEEVYAIAELIRRQKGGAAIVMGSLSPETRNSQVSLY